MRRGANLPSVGGYNRSVVLDAIRRADDGMSRVELAAATGLSSQTVSNVCRRLVDAGIVEEAGRTSGGVGKPRSLLRLVPRGGLAVGVHLDPSVITTVSLDLAGTVVEHRATATPPGHDVDAVLDAIASAVTEVLDAAPDAPLLGVGVAAPGPLDVAHGAVVDPPLLDGWGRVGVVDALVPRLGATVALEKDVTAAAVAELWTQPPGTRDDTAFFYWGTGMGIGLIVDHEVLRGSSRNAGDGAHLNTGADTPLCACGRRGCLGDSVSPACLVERARAAGVLGAGPEPSSPLVGLRDDFAALAAAAERGDARALILVEGCAQAIASALVGVVNLLDLDRVVFGGPFLAPVASLVLPRVAARLAESPAVVVPHGVRVEATVVGEDVAAIGAGCLVLDGTFTPRPADLLIERRRRASRLVETIG